MIVSSTNLEGLAYSVNRQMEDGWQPLGGPFVVGRGLWLEPKGSREKTRVAQALVKADD